MTDQIDDLIRDLTDEMGRGYRAISAAAGINMSDMLALRFIRDQDGQATPTMLARQLGMTSGATAILINRLEKQGFVERAQHPTDRRGTLLVIGAPALERGLLVGNGTQRLREGILSRYSQEEIQIIERFLADIVLGLKARNEMLEASADKGAADK